MTKGVIVNIRPPNYRQRFQEAFASVGWGIIEAPVLVPETLGAGLPDPDAYDAIIFTSQVAVELFRNAPAWHGKIAYAVGAATAEAAHDAGFARAIQTGMDAKDLAKVLAAASFHLAFYPSAEEVSADLSLDDPLRIHRLAVYRMTPIARLPEAFLELVRSGQPVIVPLFSRRSARTVERLLLEAGVTGKDAMLIAIGISADVLGAETGPWQRRVVADNPTMDALVAGTAAIATEFNAGARP